MSGQSLWCKQRAVQGLLLEIQSEVKRHCIDCDTGRLAAVERYAAHADIRYGENKKKKIKQSEDTATKLQMAQLDMFQGQSRGVMTTYKGQSHTHGRGRGRGYGWDGARAEEKTKLAENVSSVERLDILLVTADKFTQYEVWRHVQENSNNDGSANSWLPRADRYSYNSLS